MSVCITSSWHATSGDLASPADVGLSSQEASESGNPNVESQDELDQRSLQLMENFPKALYRVRNTSCVESQWGLKI